MTAIASRPALHLPNFSHLLALGLGAIVLEVSRTLLYPLLDTVAADLRLNATQSGLIASVYFVGLLAAQVALSFFGQQAGLKRILVAAYGAGGLTLLGLGLWATSYGRLLFFVTLQGLTLGVFWPVAYSLSVAGAPAGGRGQAAAFVGIGLAAGQAIGPALSGVMYEWAGGWRLPFAFMAAPTVALAVLFVLLVREAPRPAGPAQRVSWLPVLRDRNLVKLFIAGFCALYGVWAVAVWGSAYLQTERGLSLTASGLYVGLSIAVAAPAGFVWGRLSDRVGRRRLSWQLFLLAAAGLAGLAFARPPWVIIAALAAFGVGGKFAWDPVNIAWLADLTAKDPAKAVGTVVALASIFGMLSSVIGPVVNGWIRDQTGSLQGAFLVGVVLAVSGAALCARVSEHA